MLVQLTREQEVRRDRMQFMKDHAEKFLHDAEILGGAFDQRSDAQIIIRILAFEILLKCALYAAHDEPAKKKHDYKKLWSALPAEVRDEIADAATDRRPDLGDFSDITKELGRWAEAFVWSRYYYKRYEGMTHEEVTAKGEAWEAAGASSDDAELTFYPDELQALTAGLQPYISRRIAELQ